MVEFCIYCCDHCSWAWLSNLTYQGSACLDFDLNCRSHLATRREVQSCRIHAGVLLISYISVPETSPAGKLASFGNWHLGKLDRYSTNLVVENCFITLRLEQPQPDILFPCAIYWFIDMPWQHAIYWHAVTVDIPTCAETLVAVLEPFPLWF